MTSVIALIHDHMKLRTNVNEARLYDVSKVVETYSGCVYPAISRLSAITSLPRWLGACRR